MAVAGDHTLLFGDQQVKDGDVQMLQSWSRYITPSLSDFTLRAKNFEKVWRTYDSVAQASGGFEVKAENHCQQRHIERASTNAR